MNRPVFLAFAPILSLLAACGESTAIDTDDQAADFAARINGGTAAPVTQEIAEPTSVETEQEASEDKSPPPTPNKVGNTACAASLMGPFVGRPADDTTRNAATEAAVGASEVRFIEPGSDYFQPDAGNPRLNLMLDAQGIIRDALCG